MHGYQAAYQGHDTSDALLARIRERLLAEGLPQAEVARDAVGRLRLTGHYADDDEVDAAFIVLHSLAGRAAASPFYPDNIAHKRWEQDATLALQAHADALQKAAPPARKRALVIGLNRFLDSAHLQPLMGEDDARTVRDHLQAGGYEVLALFGPQASKRGMEAAVQTLSAQLGANDEFFLYISSHGALPLPGPEGGDDRHMSIVACDSGDILGRRSRDATEYLLQLQRSSVRDTVFQALANRPTRCTRVLIDTCYSGDMLRNLDDETRTTALQNERDSVALDRWAALPRRLRSRCTVLTATSPGELALGPAIERGSFSSPVPPQRELRGSFFTQALFAYLDPNQGRVQAAFVQAQRYTAQTAQALSQGQLHQTPRLLSTLDAEQDRL